MIQARLLVPLLLAGGLAACGGADGAGAGGLSVTPTSARFTAKQNGPLPPGQRLEIAVTHKDAYYLGAAFDEPAPSWVAVGAFAGAGKAYATTVSMSSTALPPGTYGATLHVGVADASQNILAVQDVAITYVVEGAAWLSPASLAFRATTGAPAPALQRVSVAAAPGFAWTVATTAPWITLDATAGVGTGTLQVGVDAAALDLGTYVGTIVVSRPGEADGAALPVTLTVADAPFSVSPATLTFGSVVRGAAPASQVASVESPGLRWIATTAAPWIVLGAASGTGSSPLQVGVDAAALEPGTYVGTVAVSQPTHGHVAPLEIRLTVADAPFSATPGTLTFTRIAGGPAPAARDVSVESPSFSWTAAADAPWITVGAAGGTGSSTLRVGVDGAALDPGSYVGTVVITRADRPASRTVQVALAVERPAIITTGGPLDFQGANGSVIASRSIGIALNSGAAVPWTASADQPWIVLSRTDAPTPGDLVVGVDPSRGPLASGAHAGTVTVTAGSGTLAATARLAVTLALAKPAFAVTPATVTLGGPLGRDPSPQTLRIALGTGTVEHRWTASAPSWITLGANAGMACAGPGTAVPVGVDVASAGPGTHRGEILLSSTINGDVVTASVPVVAALDLQQLVASDRGVAFASMPGLSRLTRTLKIRDTFGLGVAWTATADAGWVTAKHGAQPGDLVITADPTGLATGTVHEATVTIAPDAAGPAPERVRVALWASDEAPPAQRTPATSATFIQLEGDPIRPYAYVHTGGSDLTVYNVYTGEVVRTLARVAPALGGMAASLDGDRLFVVDETNLKVIPIDLRTWIVGAGWTVGSYSPGLIVYARTDGKELILAGGQAWDADTGAVVVAAGAGLTGGYVRAVSVDGTRSCTFQPGGSPHQVSCQPLGFSQLTGQVSAGTWVVSSWIEGYRGDLALTADGTRVYHQGTAFDAATGAVAQKLTAAGSSFEVTRDGRVAIGTWGFDPKYDLYVIDPAGFTLSSFEVGGATLQPVEGLMKVTGEGLCAAVITGDYQFLPYRRVLVFQLLGP